LDLPLLAAHPERGFARRTERANRLAFGVAISCIILAISIGAAAAIFPDNYTWLRAPWLLHPFEQAHLAIARDIAHGNGFIVDDPSFAPEYGSEDRGFSDGRLVPKGVLLPYFIYAVPFLVSDTAWLMVTPLFGLAAILAIGLIVRRLTDSNTAAVAAAVTFAFTAPVILATSGIAYESMIALAFLLWAVYLLDLGWPVDAPGGLVLGSGLLFGLAAASRADFAPAAMLFALLIGARAVSSWRRRQDRFSWRAQFAPAAAVFLAGLGVLSTLATNYYLNGSPLQSAYPEGTWLNNSSGVARGLVTFHLADFIEQSRYFVWDLAQPTLPLLLLGIVLIRTKVTPGVLLLVVFSGFLAFFYLGRTGAHGSEGANLDSSVARYLLPLYATAAIAGFVALSKLLRGNQHGALVASATLAGLALLFASNGIAQAYTSAVNLPRIMRFVGVLRSVHDFSALHPDATFVGDFNASGVIVTHRVLIPRQVNDHARVTEIVREEIANGRRVFVIDTLRNAGANPLYTGYGSYFAKHGLAICPTGGSSRFGEVHDLRGSGMRLRGGASLAAKSETPYLTPFLESGRRYLMTISGTFTTGASGVLADGSSVVINGGQATGGLGIRYGTYCSALIGGGGPIALSIADSFYADNSGALDVKIYEVAQ
jgi:hypothetical protein